MIELISIDHAMIRNESTNVSLLHDEMVHNDVVHDDGDVHVLVDELGYGVELGFPCGLEL
jgi:hypothetical protein